MGEPKPITMDDIVADPTKFGAPTYESFKKDPTKFLGKPDQVLATVDKGSENLKRIISKYIYEVEGYRCHTLAEVERVAGSQGIEMKDLDYQPEVIPLGGGRANLLIRFISKKTKQRRSEW